jgi:hypothetical protein
LRTFASRRLSPHPSLAFAGYLGLALLLFLVPESIAASWRACLLSSLTPLLKITARSTSAVELRPASIGVAVDSKGAMDRNESAGTRTAIDYDRASAEVVRLRDLIRHYQGMLPPKDAASNDPAGVEAGVIARKTMWQEPMLGLDKGSAEGVRNEAGVMHRGAVAGRIVAVGTHASSMALLTHRAMSVGARLVDCRIEGVLLGEKPGDGERLCRLQIVAKDLRAKAGEQVVTSGLDGTFPPGLWLGTVVSVRKGENFQWELLVRPACDENRIESVHILTVQPPEVPWPALPNKK